MAAEQEDLLLQLFDLYWFKRQILTNPSPFQHKSPNPDPNHKPPSFKAVRSFSDQSLSSKALINGGGSPNSVLAGEESDEESLKKKKSLSELEFEELKGFMDLGFLFTDKEESLKLVSILPGLQRLRGTKSIDGEDEAQMRGFSRPYLSEAWEEVEMNIRRRRKEEEDKTPLMKMKKKWRLPSVRSEADMKQHLRMWAQAVASAVR